MCPLRLLLRSVPGAAQAGSEGEECDRKGGEVERGRLLGVCASYFMPEALPPPLRRHDEKERQKQRGLEEEAEQAEAGEKGE